jgi:hypothetical protein
MHYLNFGASFTGPGYSGVSNGTTVISGKVLAENFELLNGTLQGTGVLAISQGFNWIGGTMSGGGSTSVGEKAIMTIRGSSKSLDTRTLNNAGRAIWTGGNISVSNGALFNNSGIFDVVGDPSLQYGSGATSAFYNGGIFVKSTGTGTTSLGGVVFNNAGTVTAQAGILSFVAGYIQTAGTAVLAGGGITAPPGGVLNIQAGSLMGTGTVSGNVVSAGQLNPGTGDSEAGTITITGIYTQSMPGVLNVDIGGLSPGTDDYDRLAVGGNVVLTGTLNISITHGFTPILGTTFQVLTYGMHTGSFAKVTGTDLGKGRIFVPIYNPTNLTLVVMQTSVTDPPFPLPSAPPAPPSAPPARPNRQSTTIPGSLAVSSVLRFNNDRGRGFERTIGGAYASFINDFAWPVASVPAAGPQPGAHRRQPGREPARHASLPVRRQ